MNFQKWASIGERMARAFFGAFVTQLALSGIGVSGVDDLSSLKKAAVAGGAALLSLLQSLLGGNVGNTATPSLLPARLDPATRKKPTPFVTGTTTRTTPIVVPPGQSATLPTGTWNANVTTTGDLTFTPAQNTASGLSFKTLGVDPGGAAAIRKVQEAAENAKVPRKALGRRPAKNAPALRFADHLVTVPAYPITDQPPNLTWPMDHNDTVGDCVVAGLDHALQAIYTALDGTYDNWSDAEQLTCYQTQNPKFKSWSQGGSSADGGMDIQTFLEYLVKQEIILGFAKVDHTNLDEVKAATYLGLALVTGETLTSKNMSEKVWDHHARDTEEGGHCTVTVGYDPLGDHVSWGDLYSMTDAFFQKNVEEAWFIVTEAHVSHPDFRTGFDLASFGAAYTAITGRPFPAAVTPTPTPAPADGFAAAVATVPGLDAWLVKNGGKHAMSDVDYAVWKLSGDAGLRK